MFDEDSELPPLTKRRPSVHAISRSPSNTSIASAPDDEKDYYTYGRANTLHKAEEGEENCEGSKLFQCGNDKGCYDEDEATFWSQFGEHAACRPSCGNSDEFDKDPSFCGLLFDYLFGAGDNNYNDANASKSVANIPQEKQNLHKRRQQAADTASIDPSAFEVTVSEKQHHKPSLSQFKKWPFKKPGSAATSYDSSTHVKSGGATFTITSTDQGTNIHHTDKTLTSTPLSAVVTPDKDNRQVKLQKITNSYTGKTGEDSSPYLFDTKRQTSPILRSDSAKNQHLLQALKQIHHQQHKQEPQNIDPPAPTKESLQALLLEELQEEKYISPKIMNVTSNHQNEHHSNICHSAVEPITPNLDEPVSEDEKEADCIKTDDEEEDDAQHEVTLSDVDRVQSTSCSTPENIDEYDDESDKSIHTVENEENQEELPFENKTDSLSSSEIDGLYVVDEEEEEEDEEESFDKDKGAEMCSRSITGADHNDLREGEESGSYENDSSRLSDAAGLEAKLLQSLSILKVPSLSESQQQVSENSKEEGDLMNASNFTKVDKQTSFISISSFVAKASSKSRLFKTDTINSTRNDRWEKLSDNDTDSQDEQILEEISCSNELPNDEYETKVCGDESTILASPKSTSVKKVTTFQKIRINPLIHDLSPSLVASGLSSKHTRLKHDNESINHSFQDALFEKDDDESTVAASEATMTVSNLSQMKKHRLLKLVPPLSNILGRAPGGNWGKIPFSELQEDDEDDTNYLQQDNSGRVLAPEESCDNNNHFDGEISADFSLAGDSGLQERQSALSSKQPSGFVLLNDTEVGGEKLPRNHVETDNFLGQKELRSISSSSEHSDLFLFSETDGGSETKNCEQLKSNGESLGQKQPETSIILNHGSHFGNKENGSKQATEVNMIKTLDSTRPQKTFRNQKDIREADLQVLPRSRVVIEASDNASVISEMSDFSCRKILTNKRDGGLPQELQSNLDILIVSNKRNSLPSNKGTQSVRTGCHSVATERANVSSKFSNEIKGKGWVSSMKTASSGEWLPSGGWVSREDSEMISQSVSKEIYNDELLKESLENNVNFLNKGSEAKNISFPHAKHSFAQVPVMNDNLSLEKKNLHKFSKQVDINPPPPPPPINYIQVLQTDNKMDVNQTEGPKKLPSRNVSGVASYLKSDSISEEAPLKLRLAPSESKASRYSKVDQTGSILQQPDFNHHTTLQTTRSLFDEGSSARSGLREDFFEVKQNCRTSPSAVDSRNMHPSENTFLQKPKCPTHELATHSPQKATHSESNPLSQQPKCPLSQNSQGKTTLSEHTHESVMKCDIRNNLVKGKIIHSNVVLDEMSINSEVSGNPSDVDEESNVTSGTRGIASNFFSFLKCGVRPEMPTAHLEYLRDKREQGQGRIQSLTSAIFACGSDRTLLSKIDEQDSLSKQTTESAEEAIVKRSQLSKSFNLQSKQKSEGSRRVRNIRQDDMSDVSDSSSLGRDSLSHFFLKEETRESFRRPLPR